MGMADRGKFYEARFAVNRKEGLLRSKERVAHGSVGSPPVEFVGCLGFYCVE